ncbi:decaprenylphospho-beta-D-erythro-pentofuranosid-2-ulose 2-reductase, partial [Actinospica acidiphila]|nr:decaprenylphospho-beta-D-erythro-pentofuranosid-2-ulose 2-reductase [Actinospica acidiphila]
MKDAFGLPQSLLVLGGTSEIALAVTRRLIARRTRTVWLAGRPSPGLDAAAGELRA